METTADRFPYGCHAPRRLAGFAVLVTAAEQVTLCLLDREGQLLDRIPLTAAGDRWQVSVVRDGGWCTATSNAGETSTSQTRLRAA